MDAKDLRIDAASSEHKNDGNKYAQSGTVLQCHRNKSYHDIGSNPLAKVDVPTARPCAVIGPDRVVPPPATSDSYLKKSAVEPWPCSDSAYRRPPDYPHRLPTHQNPTRNISPRQTFQENMQRIMVPPTYSSVKVNDDSSFAHIPDRSSVLTKNTKVSLEGKYCDVPYNVNCVNEPKIVRNPEVCVSSVNPTLARTAPPGWPPGSVNLSSPRTYGAPEMYQYPEYPSCAGPRSVAVPRPHRTVQEEPSYIYPDPYYQDGNIRYKPYPPPKERYPQTRYEYIGNYSNPFHPPSPFPAHKYDLQKPMHPHAYSGYTPLKFLENRMTDPIMDGYQRPNQQVNYNIAYRNQMIHPTYGPMLGNLQNKMQSYPPDGKLKLIPPNSNKMYVEYENARNKQFPMSDNFIVNEMARVNPMKSQVVMANHPFNMNPMPPHPYFKKDNPALKSYEYMTHFKNMDPSMMNNPLLRHPSRFSPSSVAISPTDSNASNETIQTHGPLQEDCGYVSQSSTASVRSMDTGINRYPHEFYRRYDYRYTPVVRTSPQSHPELNGSSNAGSNNKKSIDVRQFLQMWNEGDEETDNNNAKEAVNQPTARDSSLSKQHDVVNNNNQEQLYVLGLVNVPSEELSKYEHIQKVSKLPENIKGYNNIELLNQFEEAIESSKMNCFKPPTPRDFQIPIKGSIGKPSLNQMHRPLSPLDVEAKISQSVIHKDVGCNFEIKPCSPKMLNVEMAAPIQNILGERLIEKVANPHMISSPLLSGMDEDNYNVMKRQDHLLSMNNNDKNSSCKMVKTQYSSVNSIDCIKTNYSLQDLESNSGVCLASLPRLDNDIELSFPEVNQQFINANKSPVTQTSLNDLSTLEFNNTSENTLKNNKVLNSESDSQFSSLNDTEKEFVKLSKYRKTKPTEKREDESWLTSKTLRTDSVIIKNPDNSKTFEEHSENPIKYDTDEIQQTPINLTSYCNDINKIDSDFESEQTECLKIRNTSFDDAIDFSLNKQDYNLLDCKNNLENSSESKEEFNNKSKGFAEFDDKVQETIDSVSDQIGLKFETNTPTSNEERDEKYSEEILCHDKHLKSLPLISPNYNDSNEVEPNSTISTHIMKSNLSLESVLTVNDDLDKSSEHVNRTLIKEKTYNSKSSPKESNVNFDDVGHNCDVSVETYNENIQNSITKCDANISCESSESNISPEETLCKSYNNCNQQSIVEAVLIDDDLKSDSLKPSLEPIVEVKSLQVSYEVLLEKHDQGKPDRQPRSTFDSPENFIDIEDTTCEEFIVKTIVPSKPDQQDRQTTFLKSNINNKTVTCPIKLYSPWVQKLILYHGGICSSAANNVCEPDNQSENKIINALLKDNIDLLENETNNTGKEPDNFIGCLKNRNTDQSHEHIECESTKIDIKTTESVIVADFIPDSNSHVTDITTYVELHKKAHVNYDVTIFPFGEPKEETESRGNNTSGQRPKNTKSIDVKNTENSIVANFTPDVATKVELNKKTDINNDETIFPFEEAKAKRDNDSTGDEKQEMSTLCNTLSNNLEEEKIPMYEDSVNVGNLNYDDSVIISDIQTSPENDSSNFVPEVHEQEIKSEVEQDGINIVNSNESLELLPKNDIVGHFEKKSQNENAEHSKQILFTKRRPSLKRSLSDSDLSAYGESTEHGRNSFWQYKRRKNNKSNNPDLITEDLCSILNNNRRNSISVSACNEENVSICIFIDNNCIITEENDDEQKICYAELSEHCFADIQDAVEKEIEVENIEMLTEDSPQEDITDYVSLSESSVLECDDDKEIDDSSWVDDVACVETVVSDEIAEDITIGSLPSSPKYTDYSDNEESGVFSANTTNYHDNIIYHDKMFTDDCQLIENLYRPSQFNGDYQTTNECNKYYDKESLERVLSESNSRQGSPCLLDHNNSMFISETLTAIKTPEDKENIKQQSLSPPLNKSMLMNDIALVAETEVEDVTDDKIEKTQDDTVHSCESSIDNVFSYKEHTNCITSSSPEVSSTTSEERNSSILLKITNYKGSRISQINDVMENSKTNCKFTKDKAFVQSRPSLPLHRPLITKAAQKYIPPLKESTRDLKIKLPLPQQSLMKLKQMKNSKDKPKLNKHNLTIPNAIKKPKPKFEDVLKSIDEIQFKMHKEKSKKVKKIVPKVIIKKTQNGSHYTSTSNKDVFNPDLTGRKWQPWVFLEKNDFIDKMATKRKTSAIFNHRKNTYVLAEKFRRYKSVSSAKFVISQPKMDESSSGHLKYTIRLKHSY